MAVNPKYAALAQDRGSDNKDAAVFSWPTVGSEIVGTITYVGDLFEKDNSKFYTPEKILFDENGNKVVQKAQGTPTVTTQKIQVETRDGQTFSIYLQKKGHWIALVKGLDEAGLEDIRTGLKFKGVRGDDIEKAHSFDFKFKA